MAGVQCQPRSKQECFVWLLDSLPLLLPLTPTPTSNAGFVRREPLSKDGGGQDRESGLLEVNSEIPLFAQELILISRHAQICLIFKGGMVYPE